MYYFHRSSTLTQGLAREFERVQPQRLSKSSHPQSEGTYTTHTMRWTGQAQGNPFFSRSRLFYIASNEYEKDLRVDLMKSYTNILKFVPLNVYIISIHQATHPWIKMARCRRRRRSLPDGKTRFCHRGSWLLKWEPQRCSYGDGWWLNW